MSKPCDRKKKNKKINHLKPCSCVCRTYRNLFFPLPISPDKKVWFIVKSAECRYYIFWIPLPLQCCQRKKNRHLNLVLFLTRTELSIIPLSSWMNPHNQLEFLKIKQPCQCLPPHQIRRETTHLIRSKRNRCAAGSRVIIPLLD